MQDAATTLRDSWVDLANTLDEVAKNGPPKNNQKFDHLAAGIHEFKAWKLRIACFFDDHMIICTHGFYKKRQETPKGELEYAKKKMTAYFEAKKRGEITHAEPAQKPAARK